ncbi:Rhomboid-related protein 2 [Mactra antiquata]
MSRPSRNRRGRSATSAREIELRTVEEEDQFRRDLERQFRPVFDKHGNQGVLVSALQDELDETGIINTIPEDRLDLLIEKADRDGDAYITFAEFINMMTRPGVLSKKERRAMRGFVGTVVANIVPEHMREDFLAHYTCCPPPIFMVLMSVIEIVVFVIYAMQLKDTNDPVTATSGVPLYSPFIYKPSRRYEAWRYFTYLLIHQGYMHLVGNLVFQLLLGLPLEFVHKWWRVLIVYFCGVIAGSLAHSLTDHHVALAGASGGCYALIGAHLASVVVNWSEMNHECCEGNPIRFLLSAPVRLTVLLLLAGLDTANAVYRRFFDPAGGNIGITAHMGGLIAGLFLGIAVMKNINEKPWEKTVGWITLAVFLVFVSFSIFFNGLYQGYPETDWTACCP